MRRVDFKSGLGLKFTINIKFRLLEALSIIATVKFNKHKAANGNFKGNRVSEVIKEHGNMTQATKKNR